MTARNTSNGKRFAVRTPRRKSEPYVVSVDASYYNPSLKQSERKISYQTQPPSSALMMSRSADASTLQSDGAPSRRVVVVRNPNNPNVHQGPVDLNDFGQGNSIDISPAVSDGVSILSTVLFQRENDQMPCSINRSISFDGRFLHPIH